MEHNRKQYYLPEYDTRIIKTQKKGNYRSLRLATLAYMKYRMAQFWLLIAANVIQVIMIFVCTSLHLTIPSFIVLQIFIWLFLMAVVHIVSCIIGRIWRKYTRYLKTNKSIDEFWESVDGDSLEKWAERVKIDKQLEKTRSYL